jgi:hypothetical protein
MQETAEDQQMLADLIARSNNNAGAFLKHSFEIPAKSLSAGQLIRRLDGVVTLALGTVSSRGVPRVAPVIALFYRGAFHVPTVRDALRTRHVLNNPNVSLTLYEGNDFAVIVHGTTTIVDPNDDRFCELVELQKQHAGSNVLDWGDAVYIRVDATHLYTFARYPERFLEA